MIIIPAWASDIVVESLKQDRQRVLAIFNAAGGIDRTS
jgi:hypothetical protein